MSDPTPDNKEVLPVAQINARLQELHDRLPPEIRADVEARKKQRSMTPTKKSVSKNWQYTRGKLLMNSAQKWKLPTLSWQNSIAAMSLFRFLESRSRGPQLMAGSGRLQYL